MRILVVDNYDSFVFNLVQYLGQLGVVADVWRNDDDRSFAIRDSLTMDLSLIGAGGIDLGLLVVAIEVQAKIAVTSLVDTVVRESLGAVDANGAPVLPAPTPGMPQFAQTSFTATAIGQNAPHDFASPASDRYRQAHPPVG